MTKTETARQYRLQYGKDMPTRKLARIMYGENNLLFKDFEDARKILGNIEGKRGSTDWSQRDATPSKCMVETFTHMTGSVAYMSKYFSHLVCHDFGLVPSNEGKLSLGNPPNWR